MAFLFNNSRSFVEQLARVTAAISLAAAPAMAHAQATDTPAPTLQTVAFSTSSSGQNPFAGEDIDGRSLTSAPDGTMKTVAPQYGGGYGGGNYHRYNDNSRLSHLAFEAGGGFTAPLGNDQNGGFTSIIGDGNNYGTETWGGNFLVGAGWNFTKRFTLLGEFSYNDNKIPGRTLNAFSNLVSTQVGGNVHTLGVTAEPMYTYFGNDKHRYSAYVIGGGGYYHKSINFTEPVEEEDYYGDVFVVNATVQSYTSNALGANLGTGVAFKLFGPDSRANFFAEARYVFVDTPRETATTSSSALNTGTEELIPVTFGIRF